MGYKDSCEDCQWLEECIQKDNVKFDLNDKMWIKKEQKCIKLNFCGKGGIIWQD